MKKEYFILTPEGKIFEPEDYEFKPEEKDFKALVEKEALGKQLKGGEFIHEKAFKHFGFSWEVLSDLGHMRYGPLASFLMEMVASYSSQLVHSLSIPIYELKGTCMFDLAKKPVKEHAELYGDRLYELETEKRKLILSYAACHQQFSQISSWKLSYKHLPFGSFSISPSYRLEQSGELLLCFRTRVFYMPDLHVFCKHLEEAKEWFLRLHEVCWKEMVEKVGKNYEMLLNITSKGFFEENKAFFLKLLRSVNKPGLICVYPSGKPYYWVLNVEYHIMDLLNRPMEIGTVQIDVGNAERFGIRYMDVDGSYKHPVILHTALLGGIERYLYALFDKALSMENPCLPAWISPCQVRLIPVSEKFLNLAMSLAKDLESKGIRVEIDDRNLTVERKIREAELDWIPYSIVIGEVEAKAELPVRMRKEGKIQRLELEDFVNYFKHQVKGYPFKPLPLPILLSKRPGF